MNSYQRTEARLTLCIRHTPVGENIRIYPKKAAVTYVPDSFNYTWLCQDEWHAFIHSDVSSHPIAEADKPGDGLIGASLKKTEEGTFITWLAPDGPALASGALSEGDQILAMRPSPNEPVLPVNDLALRELVWMIRGAPGSDVTLTILRPGEDSPKDVTLTRALGTEKSYLAMQQHHAEMKRQAEAESRKELVIQNNTGQFMSPYTSDGVTAEWVNKAINANIGATTGSAVGAVAGAYAANKVLESVPFGSFLGGMIGSKVGKEVGRSTAIDSIGGWEYVRSTSDMSFRSLADMARYLKAEHGSDPNFDEVMKATSQIYPEFAPLLAYSQ
ncbi:S41 family peptidase [Marinobacter sp.]|uniref:S41 family peptidase n=1 Tax=Marinobacter sp. TaxID=50741 RepID=UPI002B274698|nr:PDZ domain-containing protein [Marinobacter sp.]